MLDLDFDFDIFEDELELCEFREFDDVDDECERDCDRDDVELDFS